MTAPYCSFRLTGITVSQALLVIGIEITMVAGSWFSSFSWTSQCSVLSSAGEENQTNTSAANRFKFNDSCCDTCFALLWKLDKLIVRHQADCSGWNRTPTQGPLLNHLPTNNTLAKKRHDHRRSSTLLETRHAV